MAGGSSGRAPLFSVSMRGGDGWCVLSDVGDAVGMRCPPAEMVVGGAAVRGGSGVGAPRRERRRMAVRGGRRGRAAPRDAVPRGTRGPSLAGEPEMQIEI